MSKRPIERVATGAAQVEDAMGYVQRRRIICAAALGLIAGAALAGMARAQGASGATAPAVSAPAASMAHSIFGVWSGTRGCDIRNDVFLIVTRSYIGWVDAGGDNMRWPVMRYEVVPDGVMATRGQTITRLLGMTDWQTDRSEPGTRVVYRREGDVLRMVRRFNARGGTEPVSPEDAVWHACD